MIIHTFISRNDDWILRHHLEVYGRVADRIIVVLDRSPQSAAICREFPNVEVHACAAEKQLPDFAPNGIICEEGRLRQMAWHLAMRHKPRLVVFGDTDEIPTPATIEWLRSNPDPAVDTWYCDWVNLYKDAGHAIGGAGSCWSFEAAGSNKKALVVRVRPDRQYAYDLNKTQHCRMEPSPLNPGRAIIDDAHRMAPPEVKLLHWKYANWPKWSESGLALAGGQYADLLKQGTVIDISSTWRHDNDADRLLEGLAEPIAVVGNGVMRRNRLNIDMHKTVIRFNNWRIEGHEKDVGHRTDVWCTNMWDDVRRRDWAGPMLTVATIAEQPERALSWLASYPHLALPRQSWTEPARRVQTENPSTGLVLLARLAQLGKQATAFGCDGMRSGHYWNPTHAHDHEDELEALLALSKGSIRVK